MHQKGIALNNIHAEQEKTLVDLRALPSDAFVDYRRLSALILEKGGKIIRFESTGDKNTFEAEFPSWATDLSVLGSGLKIKESNAHINVVKE
jgi:hypothetical protein